MTETHSNTVEAFNRPVARTMSTLTAAAKRDAIREALLAFLPERLTVSDAAKFVGVEVSTWRKRFKGEAGPVRMNARIGRGARVIFRRDDYVDFLMRCLVIAKDHAVRPF